MNTIAEIIGPAYQRLSLLCRSRHIILNLDLEDPTTYVLEVSKLRAFLKNELSRAIKACGNGDQITIASRRIPGQAIIFSVNCSQQLFDATQQAVLEEQGYIVHSRYGYGTTVSVTLR